jgi:oxygen-independent coproporphyrinogen-3 oxidase
MSRRLPTVTEDPSAGALDRARPLGIYVHVPFCSVRCPYCDFAIDTRQPIPHARYGDAVVAELEARAPWFGGGGAAAAPEVRSVYFGGGTPGLWEPGQVGRVLGAVRRLFPTARLDALEITLEANPAECAPPALAAWRAAGVNRLSLGVQAFDDGLLAAIGRNHRSADVPVAFHDARRAGFDNITCDLMYGLPGQTPELWQRSVDALVALGPEHVSAYALTVERGTPFGSLDRAGRLERPEDDAVAALFTWGRARLAAAGYAHYEVSSYARAGRQGVHNGLYWNGGAYLGVGAGAASFRPLEDGSGWRFTNPRATETYLRSAEAREGGVVPASVERRTPADLENEALWLALRTAAGVDRPAHAARYGTDPLAAPGRQAAAARCEGAGWLEVTPAAVRLTPEGFLFADEVAARLWA